MKIWIVRTVDCDGGGPLHGAFSTREKADHAIDMLSRSGQVCEVDLRIDCLEIDILEMPTDVMNGKYEDVTV